MPYCVNPGFGPRLVFKAEVWFSISRFLFILLIEDLNMVAPYEPLCFAKKSDDECIFE